MKIGSHVGMSGKEMMLGSVKEALSYDANTFMLYTGAPQNTRRKDVSELRVEEAWELMRANDITEFVVHAPYIINLANTVKPEIYQLAVDFLKTEIERTAAMGSKTLVLHPGSHVNAGVDAGIDSIVKGLNEVLTQDTPVHIALETMAGKGSEIGRSFEELARIYDGVQIAVFHINDSKNPRGASKDRHENIGLGSIGFDALYKIVWHKDFLDVPKILETPYVKSLADAKKAFPPYKEEIDMLRSGAYDAARITKLAE